MTGLQIGYLGSVSYLTEEERTQTIAWLQAQERWSVAELQTYLKTTFEVEYQSLQSYDDLLHAAGLSWQKTQAQSPKKTIKPSRPNAKNERRIWKRTVKKSWLGRARCCSLTSVSWFGAMPVATPGASGIRVRPLP
ncbi:winged helix-turn-helix domain-containing protein [Candidatus Chloroploca mongolica]|uniref:winged helix-turn-helix domain-containing protein n=1 Tax=Candidatus Chloroploca mongolica TaxID=2528176 RepID=UPI003FCE180F